LTSAGATNTSGISTAAVWTGFAVSASRPAPGEKGLKKILPRFKEPLFGLEHRAEIANIVRISGSCAPFTFQGGTRAALFFAGNEKNPP